jgi:hypothetical protein
MPDWDQWDAEALETYVPWFTGDKFLQHLFNPHNEHRVILTKLQNLALVLLNGQWDSRLEAVTNAALHAALGVAFWVLGHRILTSSSVPGRTSATTPGTSAPSLLPPSLLPRSRIAPLASGLLFLLAFALFGLPFAWQNVLGGFHSQQYWLAGLSFAAIVTLPFARALSAAWWLGALSAVLVLGSMGSGFLAAFAVMLVIAFRLFRRETTLRTAAPTLALCLALVLIGVLTRHEVPWHAEMKAKSVHDFVFSIIHSLQWPWRDKDWAALVLWLPWLLLALHVFRASPAPLSAESSRSSQAVLALGGWVLLQLAATAYARGAGADYPASRYMDTLTFGALANALALACLLRTARLRFLARGPSSLLSSLGSVVVSLVWLVTLSTGLYNYLAHTARWELEDAKKYYVKAESNMRRYLATNDPRHLAAKDIPFPSPEGLAERLAIPSLRALIAVPLRTPLAIQSATPTPTAAASPAGPGFVANTAIPPDINLEHPPRAGLSPATAPLDYTTTWGSYAEWVQPDVASPPSLLAAVAARSRASTPASAPPTPAPQVFRSQPLAPSRFAYLKFEVAGDLGRQGAAVSLQLLDATTGSLLADVRPSRPAGDAWRSAYVRTPERPFIIAATDASAEHWLAFSPPVEMGAFSFLAWQATKHAMLILQITIAVTLLLLVLARALSAATPRQPQPVAV